MLSFLFIFPIESFKTWNPAIKQPIGSSGKHPETKLLRQGIIQQKISQERFPNYNSPKLKRKTHWMLLIYPLGLVMSHCDLHLPRVPKVSYVAYVDLAQRRRKMEMLMMLVLKPLVLPVCLSMMCQLSPWRPHPLGLHLNTQIQWTLTSHLSAEAERSLLCTLLLLTMSLSEINLLPLHSQTAKLQTVPSSRKVHLSHFLVKTQTCLTLENWICCLGTKKKRLLRNLVTQHPIRMAQILLIEQCLPHVMSLKRKSMNPFLVLLHLQYPKLKLAMLLNHLDLPRCVIFWQGNHLYFGSWHRHSLLLACFFCFLLHMHANLLVLRFYAAKMFHLSVPRCVIFWQGNHLYFCSWHRHSLLLVCFFCFLLHMHANLLVLRFYAAKMFHLSVATCQDVSSFGRGTICIFVVGIGTLCYQHASFVFYYICMPIYQYFGSMLPRCFIFRQLPAKMCHLLVGEPFVFWQLASALFVTSMLLLFFTTYACQFISTSVLCCQDVSSFGSYLPRCVIFWQGNHLYFGSWHRHSLLLACFFCFLLHMHANLLVLRFYAAKMFHLSVPRCVIFWQGNHLYFCSWHRHSLLLVCFFVFYYICMPIYQYFSSMLPRCFIFRQLPAKMCHLLVGEPFVFWQLASALFVTSMLLLFFTTYACQFISTSVLCCQDVSSFGSYLPRCVIFWQGNHLYFCSWHRHSLLLACFFCFLLHMHANLLVLRFYAAKMFHLSVATCQDVSSFGRGTICILVVGIGTLCYQYASFVFYYVCMPIYQYFGSMLPRCFIFRQLPAKMCHLLVGEPFVFWQLASALFVTSMLFLFFTAYACQFISTSVLGCQDVSSFGSYLPRCVIFWQGNHLYFGSWHRHSLLLVCFSCFFTIKMVYAVVCMCLYVCMCGACVHSCVHKCPTHMCASYYVHACVCVPVTVCVVCVEAILK